MGLPIFESAELWDRVAGGQQIEVDGDAGRILIVGSEAQPLSIEPIPPFMQELIRDGGLMRHITLKRQHAQGRK
jgi:3-isopropylmalate/(R)-2-methylmalate dehydratase small subunit